MDNVYHGMINVHTIYKIIGSLNSLNKDIEVDTYIRFGTTTPPWAAKLLCYKSTAEHSFSFIDSDIQNPDYVIMDRWIPSRSFNKETADHIIEILYVPIELIQSGQKNPTHYFEK
jgi:hypothetical protein